ATFGTSVARTGICSNVFGCVAVNEDMTIDITSLAVASFDVRGFRLSGSESNQTTSQSPRRGGAGSAAELSSVVSLGACSVDGQPVRAQTTRQQANQRCTCVRDTPV